MAEDTTTSDSDAEAAEVATTDAEEVNTEAVTEDENTSQTSETEESGSEESDNPEEAELKEWAAKKNLPDDPIKLAKIIRDQEKQIGKQGSKEGLKKAVSTANDASNLEDYQALKNEVEALSFYVNHPEAKQLESTMIDVLEEKPYLASDLEAVLEIAKGRSYTDAGSLLAAKQAGSKEALAQAAKAGRAAQPRTSATNTATATRKITSDNVEQVVAQHMGDTAWYKEHLAEINAALA